MTSDLGEFNNVKDAGTRAKAFDGAILECSPITYKPGASDNRSIVPIRMNHDDQLNGTCFILIKPTQNTDIIIYQ